MININAFTVILTCCVLLVLTAILRVDHSDINNVSHRFQNRRKCRHIKPYAHTHDILLVGGSIITMADVDTSLITDGTILVCKGTIVFVGSRHGFSKSSARFACRPKVLHLHEEDVVVPAFINTHTHAAMSLFKNLGNDRDLSDWLNNFIFPLEGGVADEEFCRAGVNLAMLEFLAGGTSTFADMYFHQDAAAEEVSQVGMRAFLGESIIDFPQSDSPNPENTLVIGEKFIRRWLGHELITPLMAPHAPYTTSASVYQRAADLNRKYGVRTLTHCSETQAENANMRKHQNLADDSTTATQWLRDIGVLGPDVTCAHSVWLTDDDIKIYKKTGTKVGHCPSSNMKLASGFMRYTAMKEAGIPIGFGTDGHASNNDVDLVEESRMASLIHKGVDLNPKTLPALDALRHLTMGGAIALGREAVQGSIEAGKFGDFAIFNGRSAKWTPRYDIRHNGTLSVADTAALITYDANGYDVKGTVVNGKLLYFDGCFSTLNVARVISKAQAQGKRIRDHLAASRR